MTVEEEKERMRRKVQEMISSPTTVESPRLSETLPGMTPEGMPPFPSAGSQDASSIYQRMLNSRRNEIRKQMTSDARMAAFNSLGNVLTTMVQPLGWAAGNAMAGGGTPGATSGVQPYDNRQYLEAFNRAIKASDDLRNIGTMEDEYRFKLADEEERRQRALADYRSKAELDAKIQSDYAKERHAITMEEIAARGDVQMQVAAIKASKVTKDGRPISEDQLKTARTQWYRYLGRYWDDLGRGIQRREKNGPLSFSQFLTSDEGGGYKVDMDGSESVVAPYVGNGSSQPSTSTSSVTDPYLQQ